ncbi:hypothetical protein L1987_01469 [Smallanthus sonchifolius]|uniref:Uncharacterized protein n=1 Tax=Smallanthus sonchifolius TaxID=185202 RepID=A0ACB9K5A4_9ASTR|nr:hypothetical protein L1987_01469 [Smallanthus sonchifolius]
MKVTGSKCDKENAAADESIAATDNGNASVDGQTSATDEEIVATNHNEESPKASTGPKEASINTQAASEPEQRHINLDLWVQLDVVHA